MNIQEISTFLAICKYGSFNKAAEHLYMTQPTVSWYVTTLEKELGHQLFIRKRGQKESVLTDSGKLFYQQALKWEALWNETVQLLDTKVYVRYNFAMVHSLSHRMIPFLHTWFEERMPDWSVAMASRTSSNIISGVENGDLDAGLACITTTSDRVNVKKFASEDCVFVCGKDSDYPDHIHLQDLDISNHIAVSWTEELRAWRQRYFFGKPYAELSSFDELTYFFNKPGNWSIFPYSSWYEMRDTLKTCELDVKPPERPFYLVTPPNYRKSEFTKPLEDALREFFSPYMEGVHIL